MIPRSATHSAILRCMQGVQRARDGRGVAQNRAALLERLLRETTPTIALLTTRAAVVVAQAVKARAEA